MRFLLEDYDESEELNTFVYQARARFNPYYEVILKVGKDTSYRYFAYEQAARAYYDGLLKEMKSNKEYYDGARVTFNEIKVNLEAEELEDEFVYNDPEEGEEDFSFIDEELGIKKSK